MAIRGRGGESGFLFVCFSFFIRLFLFFRLIFLAIISSSQYKHYGAIQEAHHHQFAVICFFNIKSYRFPDEQKAFSGKVAQYRNTVPKLNQACPALGVLII